MQMGLNWADIDTVLLDMDGTLLDLHFDNFFWLNHLPDYYAAKFPGKEQLARDTLTRQLSEKQGTLEWYCTKFWSDELDLDIIALKKQIGHLINERPQSLLFLEALGRQHKRRVLVTNAHPDSITIKFSATRIEPLLDQVISSHDYGYPKESPKFWNALQKHSPFNPAKTLFIDDSIAVLNAAKNYGIAHILCIDKPDSTRSPSPCAEFPSISHFDELLTINGALHNA
jgi:putative hydrolase of the HAD superfamily|tara:strand:- start:253 stop:936 length:684 start_codon:yes stop_codon:yes gene_type:complete